MNIDINVKKKRLRKIVLIPIIIFVFALGSFLFLSYSNKEDKEQNVDIKIDEVQVNIERLKRNDRDIYNKNKFIEIKKEVKGIDVSSWQGDINWEKVKNSGIDFVMIRCGFRNLSDAGMGVDKKFKYNIEQANLYDIPVGVYFYSTAINKLEVYEEASFVLNLIKDYKITYPVVYDFELFNQKRTKGVNLITINENALVFLNYMKNHGYEGMLYSNLYSLENYWILDELYDYKVWYAHYIDTNSYDPGVDMWQYADNGRIDGIYGNVDLNLAYFAYEAI